MFVISVVNTNGYATVNNQRESIDFAQISTRLCNLDMDEYVAISFHTDSNTIVDWIVNNIVPV